MDDIKQAENTGDAQASTPDSHSIATTIVRRSNGQFQKGVSGNPSGKPVGAKPNPVKEILEVIANHEIKITRARQKRLGIDKDKLTTLEHIFLDWATSLSPAKQQMFIERVIGKVPNVNLNTNQNIDIVSKFKSKFTDSELESIAGGADALEILLSKLPDVSEE